MADETLKPNELVSLNDALIDCNFDDVSAEELERRLELAVGMVVDLELSCSGFENGSCGTNSCSGFYGGSCGTN